ncbi:MAG: glycosyltransferase family 9 protein [Bdellovibrionota bacterium]
MAQIPDSSSKTARLLIIRFSSLGDIIQAAAVPKAFKNRFPGSKVEWLVRSDFKDLLAPHKFIDEVISFGRSEGFWGLINLAWKLGQENHSHVYDAHSNVRSTILSTVLRFRRFARSFAGAPPLSFAVRKKDRIDRWLLFKFRIRRIQMPFRGAESFHRPLTQWGLEATVPEGQQFFPSGKTNQAVTESLQRIRKNEKTKIIALAPSAAWEMKRWPVEHWKSLIANLPDYSFVLLGGPEDRFLSEIAAVAPDRVADLSGRMSLDESASFLSKADLVIANDTGMLHIADQMEIPAIALIGPTAFGYPSHRTSITAEVELWCKPCSKDGRGKCVNDLYKRCLVEVSPERIAKDAIKILSLANGDRT